LWENEGIKHGFKEEKRGGQSTYNTFPGSHQTGKKKKNEKGGATKCGTAERETSASAYFTPTREVLGENLKTHTKGNRPGQEKAYTE